MFKQFCRCEVTEQIDAEIKKISRLGRQYPAEKYSGISIGIFGEVRAVEYAKDDENNV